MDTAVPPSLPPAAADYLRRVLPRDRGVPSSLRLAQRGTMWRTPGGRGAAFTAEQRFATTRIEFDWHARFALLPGVWLGIHDAFVDGHGRLEGRLWDRIAVMRNTGVEIDRGEILRYLAELAWNPHAMLANPQLEWRELGVRRLEVAAAGITPRCAIELLFDDHGDIVQAGTAARGYLDGKRTVMRPWGGRFWDYRSYDHVRMPRFAEVWWDLPSGRFTYWRGEVTEVEHTW